MAKQKRAASVERPFPRVTLEQTLRVPTAIKEKNAGNPWASEDVAKALGLGAKGNQFYYITAASRDHGFTEGTRNTDKIELTTLGNRAVYPANDVERRQALLDAFFKVEVYRKVFQHYKGSELPEKEFLSNTLQKEFGLDPRVHDDFTKLYEKNCEFVGVHSLRDVERIRGAQDVSSQEDAATVTLATPAEDTGKSCFVIMPFRERDDNRPEGFFEEVLKALIVPAAKDAGFVVRSAQRSGSDVIQQTIVQDLLAADLVVADLTEHNPNVMFELGMRMREDKPVALIREIGTGSIFDVDNMLRVYDYDGRLWNTTVEEDLPALTEHIRGTWDNREAARTYYQMLSGG